jgi:serine-type D-Ala-D-Ala carboxypeptidase
VGSAIEAGVAPGAALAVGRHGRLVHLRGYGADRLGAGGGRRHERTLSRPGLPHQGGRGHHRGDDPGGGGAAGRWTAPSPAYLPELADAGEGGDHACGCCWSTAAGLEAFAPLFREVRGREQYLEQIDARPLATRRGRATEYSDWDLILLQLVIERSPARRWTGSSTAASGGRWGWPTPGSRPDPALRDRIAPTEVQDAARGGLVHGVVHDPTPGRWAGWRGTRGSSRARGPGRLRADDAERRRVRGARLVRPRRRALDGAAGGGLQPRAGVGHPLARLQRRPLLLPAQPSATRASPARRSGSTRSAGSSWSCSPTA